MVLWSGTPLSYGATSPRYAVSGTDLSHRATAPFCLLSCTNLAMAPRCLMSGANRVCGLRFARGGSQQPVSAQRPGTYRYYSTAPQTCSYRPENMLLPPRGCSYRPTNPILLPYERCEAISGTDLLYHVARASREGVGPALWSR
eukprot:1162808-Rhodomonas_salina.1